jgi:hypothetical protein
MSSSTSISKSQQICLVAGAALVVALWIKRRQKTSRYIDEGRDPERNGVSLSLLNAPPIMGKEKVNILIKN